MEEYMLSTSDNPFNPYTHWDQWYTFDVTSGYHTSSYLARLVMSSHELSDADQDVAINDAMEEILEFNLTGNYIKVSKPTASPVASTTGDQP